MKVKYWGSGCVGTVEQDPAMEKALLHKFLYLLPCYLIGFIFFPKMPQK